MISSCLRLARYGSAYAAVLAAVLFGFNPAAKAERPGTPELFPKDTAALIRIPSMPALNERFMNTSLGKMSQDEQIGPLLAELYGSATELFKEHVEGEVGVSLEDILALPQGEVAFGVVTTEGVRPAYIFLMDAGDKADAAKKLLTKATDQLDMDGYAKTTEKVEELDLELTIYDIKDDFFPQLVLFEKDATFVAVSSLEVAKNLLTRWTNASGKPGADTLAKNERYAAIMKRCRGEKGQLPHVTYFADPMTILKSAAVGNIEMTLTLAILPQLGLDGFSGIGGSLTFDAEPYDYISHFHVLLENPRTGVLKALAMTSGDITPPAWVPADANSYICGHWDFRTTYEQIAKMVDSFQGEGRTAEAIQNFMTKQWEGMDFEKDLLDQFAGRVIHVTWMEPPASLMSQAQCIAVEIKDPEGLQVWVDKIAEKYKDGIDKFEVGKITYYQPKNPANERERRRRERERSGGDDQPEPPQAMGFPMPCLAIVDNYVIVARESFLKKIVLAKAGASGERLADSLEFKLVQSRFERVSPGMKPGLITYNQPEEGMRWVYDFVTGPTAKEFLDDPDAPEPVLKLRDALEKHPLPPFAVIKKYLAPTGGVMVNEPTGFHYTGFGLRRSEEK